jgi:hypothetical protein
MDSKNPLARSQFRVLRRALLAASVAAPWLPGLAMTANGAADPLAFRRLAPTPPMGWNSWDSFATTLTEDQAIDNAKVMAKVLLPHGYDVFTVDIQWYEPGATGFDYRKDAHLELDPWGRLLPAVNRFPSSAAPTSTGVAGFKPLGDRLHALGLKFGIHLMRGAPRQAADRNLPVLGTDVRIGDIVDRASLCPWNPDMYGVDMTKPGAQAYYDSVFKLLAAWGVDYVKVDDMSRPYHDHAPEIEAVRKAIDASGRPMVLSLSPGETPLDAASHVQRHANLWRISDDFWDQWPLLMEQFGRLERWNPYRIPGCWPDADMLPLGVLDLGKRTTRFTPDEQRTMMTLWSIARSPLIMGGDLRKLDPATTALLTNDEVLAVNQRSTGNRPVINAGGSVVWTAEVPGSTARYLALFNTTDEEMLVRIDLGLAGVKGRVSVRDLWARKDDGAVEHSLRRKLPPHGAGLYRIG